MAPAAGLPRRSPSPLNHLEPAAEYGAEAKIFLRHLSIIGIFGASAFPAQLQLLQKTRLHFATKNAKSSSSTIATNRCFQLSRGGLP
jgi:hypothetical protein